MEAEVFYIWTDDDGLDRISKDCPADICFGMFGNKYTPDYKKVVVIPLKE